MNSILESFFSLLDCIYIFIFFCYNVQDNFYPNEIYTSFYDFSFLIIFSRLDNILDDRLCDHSGNDGIDDVFRYLIRIDTVEDTHIFLVLKDTEYLELNILDVFHEMFLVYYSVFLIVFFFL